MNRKLFPYSQPIIGLFGYHAVIFQDISHVMSFTTAAEIMFALEADIDLFLVGVTIPDTVHLGKIKSVLAETQQLRFKKGNCRVAPACPGVVLIFNTCRGQLPDHCKLIAGVSFFLFFLSKTCCCKKQG